MIHFIESFLRLLTIISQRHPAAESQSKIRLIKVIHLTSLNYLRGNQNFRLKSFLELKTILFERNKNVFNTEIAIQASKPLTIAYNTALSLLEEYYIPDFCHDVGSLHILKRDWALIFRKIFFSRKWLKIGVKNRLFPPFSSIFPK